MRIGVDASCWVNRRGYGRYTRELLRMLLELDHENEYWLFLDAETARRSEDLPERAHRVVVGTSRPAAEAASASGHRPLRDLWAMRMAVQSRRRQLDLLYFPSVYTFFPLGGRPKIVVTIHDTIAEHHPELIFPTWRSRMFWTLKVWWAIRQADLITTVSEAAREDLARTFGLRKETIHVVPDAVNPAFHPLHRDPQTPDVLAKYGLVGDARIILYVGGLSPHKNLTTLVDAYARLIGSRGMTDVRLALVGDVQGDVFHSCYPALRDRVVRLGLIGNVVFTGFITDEDLVHFYNAAAVLVIPSFDEGFGLPAVEAMACGTPVVASRAGALPEVVDDGGLFFDPGSPEELTARLREVLQNSELRHSLRQAGLRRAREFTWDRSAQAALAAFARVTRPS